MRCPICAKAGVPHQLKETRVKTKASPSFEVFYDYHDKKHIHDPEVRTFVYECSQGHHFRIDGMSRCTVQQCYWNERPEVKNGQKTLEQIHAEATQKTDK